MTGLGPEGYEQWLGMEPERQTAPSTTDTPVLDTSSPADEEFDAIDARWTTFESTDPADVDSTIAEESGKWSHDIAPDSSGGDDQRRRRRQLLAIVVGVLVGLLIMVVGLIVLLGGGGDQRSPQASEPSQAAPPAPADADCPSGTNGDTTTGRDRGDTTTGPGVIKAFDYGYYVERSGDAARSVVSPTAKVTSAQQIQSGIDKLDPQTLHCLSIVDKGAGLYAVAVTEIPPRGEEPSTWHQLIQTTSDKGRTWIVSIQKDPSAEN